MTGSTATRQRRDALMVGPNRVSFGIHVGHRSSPPQYAHPYQRPRTFLIASLRGRLSWIATAPRILATILNEGVVAGMSVLPRRFLRSVPASTHDRDSSAQPGPLRHLRMHFVSRSGTPGMGLPCVTVTILILPFPQVPSSTRTEVPFL